MLFRLLALATLIFGFVLIPVAPEVANVGVLVVAGFALVLLARDADWRAILRRPGVLLPLLGVGLLTLALLLPLRPPEHFLLLAYLAPLLLVGPLVALFGRAGALVTPGLVGAASLLGVLAGLGLTLYDSLVLGLERAGWTVNNPIHVAALVLALGFLAPVGLLSRHPARLLLLGAPPLSVYAALLTGSRGPLLAAAAMLAVALVAGILALLPRRAAFGVIAAGAVLALAGLYAVLALDLVAHLPYVGQRLDRWLSGEEVDMSVVERLVMLEGAWHAFLASPLFGHGFVDFVAVAGTFHPAGPEGFPGFDNLHSDPANMAVIGGVLGLAALLLFLAAPVAEGLLAPAGRERLVLGYAGAALSVGYLVMGQTNSMFGVLAQSILFAVALAALCHLARGAAR